MRSIRRAVADDAFIFAELNRFVQELHLERRPDQFRSPTSQELATWYQSRLGDPATNGWIAEIRGVPVGLRTIEASAWAFNEEIHRLLERLGFTPKVIRYERTDS